MKTRKGSRARPSDDRLTATDSVTVRHCHGIVEFEGCVAVERAVWRSADIDVVPIPLFVVAAETGGQVLGAFDGERMVGFTLAVAGWRDRTPFLHSHMNAVLPEYRDRGVGRRLKLFQREDALKRGINRIEWTFDPLIPKNAYFNFMRLGAIARRYLPNAYGITTSPLSGPLPTDRLIAEWHLRSSRVRRVLAGLAPITKISKNAVRIPIPSDFEALRNNHPAGALEAQSELRSEFLIWLKRGYSAVAVEDRDGTMEYILEPGRAA